jgi:3-oxoadipate enol-lactonase
MPTFLTNHGEKIYYIDENSPGSRVMLLLHGLGVNSRSWLLQIPAFTGAGYRILAPDLPGFGQSCKTRFSSIPQIASEVETLLQSSQVTDAIVCGISMGGILALQLTLDHPDMVNRLILVNSMAKLSIGNPLLWPYFLWRYLLVQTRGLEDQAEVVANRLFPQPEDSLYRQAAMESIMEADLESYKSAMKSIARFNVQKRLPEIQCPTLVITGENDTTIPAKYQRRMAERIPDASHIVIKNAGHAVTIDQPDLFNSSVLEFLEHRVITENPPLMEMN